MSRPEFEGEVKYLHLRMRILPIRDLPWFEAVKPRVNPAALFAV